MMDYYDRKDNPAFGNTMSAGKFLSRFLHKLMSKRCLFILSPLIFVLVMPAFAAALPSTPTGVSATAVSSDEIQVSWNTSTNANGYELWRSSTIDGTSPGTMIGTTTSTSYSDTGRSPNTEYCYQVLAYDSASNESDLSTQSCATTLSAASPLPIPTGASASAVSSDEIQVSWNTSTGADGYELWRSSAIDGTSPGTMIGTTTSTSYSDTGRSPNTEYCYQVLAYDSAGNESDLSTQSCATTLSAASPLPIPTGVSASAVSSDEIQVSWNTSTGADGYELWRSSAIDGTSPGTMIGTTTSTSYSDT